MNLGSLNIIRKIPERAKKRIAAAVAIGIVSSSGYVFSTRSINNIIEVDPDLQRSVKCALNHTKVDFTVIDGMRTAAEHKINVANGKSWTKRSRHQDGKAIDFVALQNGKVTYEPMPYYAVASAFYYCEDVTGVQVTWGGEWDAQDLMHIELDRQFYP